MNRKETGDFLKNNIIPPFMIVALFLALARVESCNNSLNERVYNQAIEDVRGELGKYELFQKHTLVPLNEAGSEYSDVQGYFKPDEHNKKLVKFAWKMSDNQTIYVSHVPFENAIVTENSQNRSEVILTIDPENYVDKNNDPLKKDINGYVLGSKAVFTVPSGEARRFLEMQKKAQRLWWK